MCIIFSYRSYARLIWSARPGMGKSLCVKRMGEIFQQKAVTDSPILTIPIHGPIVEIERILEHLCQGLKKIIHFDIAPSVKLILLLFEVML